MRSWKQRFKNQHRTNQYLQRSRNQHLTNQHYCCAWKQTTRNQHCTSQHVHESRGPEISIALTESYVPFEVERLYFGDWCCFVIFSSESTSLSVSSTRSVGLRSGWRLVNTIWGFGGGRRFWRFFVDFFFFFFFVVVRSRYFLLWHVQWATARAAVN